MNEKVLDKELFVKYLKFLIDFSDRLLTTGEFESEFENISREYGLFLHRLLSSNKIDENVKKEIVEFDLFIESDLKENRSSFSEGFLSQIPFFNKMVPAANRHVKIGKLTKMHECLSLILFKVDGYNFL